MKQQKKNTLLIYNFFFIYIAQSRSVIGFRNDKPVGFVVLFSVTAPPSLFFLPSGKFQLFLDHGQLFVFFSYLQRAQLLGNKGGVLLRICLRGLELCVEIELVLVLFVFVLLVDVVVAVFVGVASVNVISNVELIVVFVEFLNVADVKLDDVLVLRRRRRRRRVLLFEVLINELRL